MIEENYTEMTWRDFLDWIRNKNLVNDNTSDAENNQMLIFDDDTSAIIRTSVNGMACSATPYRSKKTTPDNFCEDKNCISCNGIGADGHHY